MTTEREAFLELFVSECDEQLAAMEKALVELESRGDDPETIAVAFRGAHTVKGDAHSLGFDALVAVAHAAEEVLDGLRAEQLAVTPERITLLLGAVDVLRRMAASAVRGDETMPAAGVALIDELRADLQRKGRTWAEAAHEGEVRPSNPLAGASRTTLRIDVARLDRMLDLVGEIATARERLSQILDAVTAGPGRERARDAHREADRLYAELHELVTQARLVPLGPTFRSFARSVRDLATQTGKRVSLVVQGDEVEVDTAVVEQLRGPLTHMIRNAIVHGIERPEDRAATGKPVVGTVALRARHEGRHVVVEIADDGAGLDRPRILAEARARGLVPPSAEPTAGELDQLIFHPGLSTASTVTELSGRGVGMDVVRKNIESLRGSVSVASGPGQGTTVTARLPLTLAIIDGFSVGVDNDTYVVPMDAVLECVELREEHGIERERESQGVLSLRGEPLPYLRLRDVFGTGGQAPARENVVVIRHGSDRAGIAVDTLHGAGQTVIKPLGRLFDGARGVSGSAVLGSGRVAMILDIPKLIREALARAAGPSRSGVS
jgi:two-component system chemotaxis sensor kinase CheA